MERINWEIFAGKVPAGSHCSYDWAGPNNAPLEGIVVSNVPFQDWEYDTWEGKFELTEGSCRLKVQVFEFGREAKYCDAPKMKFLINDQWLTFDQVMSQAR